MECRVIITDQTANPIWGDFAEIELNNNTPHRIEIETNLASGLLTFVDVEVTDKDNRRVSKPFHSAMIASPRDRSSVVATLKPGERLRHKIGLFSSIDQADLKPGQYKVRVRFKYDKYDMKSEYVNVILTEKHLRETPEFGDLFSVP